ncbi:MAG: hypothetical protein AAF841_10550, partial [Pseudomonadota bacterium]
MADDDKSEKEPSKSEKETQTAIILADLAAKAAANEDVLKDLEKLKTADIRELGLAGMSPAQFRKKLKQAMDALEETNMATEQSTMAGGSTAGTAGTAGCLASVCGTAGSAFCVGTAGTAGAASTPLSSGGFTSGTLGTAMTTGTTGTTSTFATMGQGAAPSGASGATGTMGTISSTATMGTAPVCFGGGAEASSTPMGGTSVAGPSTLSAPSTLLTSTIATEPPR